MPQAEGYDIGGLPQLASTPSYFVLRQQAQEAMQAIASRLAECGLTMHPEKSKIVYCKDRSRTQTYPNVTFTFLGFQFRPRRAQTKYGQVSTSFLPGVSPVALKRMRDQVRGWRLTQFYSLAF
jgi:RNA-directed DNA polymerase